VGGPARGTWPQGDGGHAVPGFAVSRWPPARPASPIVDVWDGSSTKPAASCCRGRTSKVNSKVALLRRRVFHQARRTQPRAYVEREITRHMASRSAPIALPSETRDAGRQCLPGQPAPRPLAGRSCRWWPPPSAPINSWAAPAPARLRRRARGANAGQRRIAGSAAGRADDFAWPRREGRTRPRQGRKPVAAVGRRRRRTRHQNEKTFARSIEPTSPNTAKPPHPIRHIAAPQPFRIRKHPAPPPARAPAVRARRGKVGPSASAPGFFSRSVE